MTISADRRGWGRGWPKDNSSKWVEVRAKISGAVWLVDYRIAPILQFLVDTVEATGHLYDYGPMDVNDDWGAVNRPIAGTSIPSNHSWGLAIDADAQNYPQGQTKRRPPQWIIDLFRKYRFDNGVYWANPDPMHFEFNGTPADAAFLVASLAGHHIEGTPPPIPPSAPNPILQEDEMKPILVQSSDGTTKPGVWLLVNGWLFGIGGPDVGAIQNFQRIQGYDPTVHTVEPGVMRTFKIAVS